jgi:hypothetical protein
MIVPGLWTVNVSKSTAGAFTTSRNHHFLSFVTMIGPSPDWIAGKYRYMLSSISDLIFSCIRS